MKYRSVIITLWAVLILAIVACCTLGIVEAQNPATINWTNQHQAIAGFGAADQQTFSGSAITSAQAQMFFSQTNGIGLSILRTVIPDNGSYPGNCASVGSGCVYGPVIADMQSALANNPSVKIIASSWSPPASMKSNGSEDCSAGVGNGTLIGSSQSAYASWITNWVSSVKSIYGITPYAVSPQNEPEECESYPSSLLAAGGSASSSGFDYLVKTYLGPDMSAAGNSSTTIFIPESDVQGDVGTYAGTCLGDSSCYPYIGFVATHNYDFGAPGASPYNTYWMTEVSGCATSVTSADYAECAYTGAMNPDGLYWAYNIWTWMVANANAWVFWAEIPYSSPYPNTGLLNTNGSTIPQRFWAVGNYSKFVGPGWYRIDCPGQPQSGMYVSCYNNPTTGALAVVVINDNGSATSQTFALSNAPTFTSLTPYVTSTSFNLAAQSAVSVSGQTWTYSYPADSVTTFYGTGSSAPPSTTQAFIAGGGSSYMDSTGQVWTADPIASEPSPAGCTGTTGTYNVSNTISNTKPSATDQALYQTERYGACTWVITIPNGNYNVLEKFSENYFTAAGDRVFSETINGSSVLSNFDIFATTGAEFKGVDYTFPVTVSGGTITLAFQTGSANFPKVDAIMVSPNSGTTPAGAPTITPITGTYTSPQTVTMTCTTPGCSIFYTTNGTTPTPSSTPYTTPFSQTIPATVQAVATATGYSTSAVTSETYTLQTSSSYCPTGFTCHYIDYPSGSDSNSGTSESAPWKHAPGMEGLNTSGGSTGDGCTANCASFTPVAGDAFILKGGTVWPYTTAPWVWTWSGSGTTSGGFGCTGSGCIYIGYDPSWNQGKVNSVTLQRDLGGCNPSAPPTVFFSGGGGSGAAATAEVIPSAAGTQEPNVAGFVYDVIITSQGSGYTSNPSVTISGNGCTLVSAAADIQRPVFDYGGSWNASTLTASGPAWPVGTASFPLSYGPGFDSTGAGYIILDHLEFRNLLQAFRTSGIQAGFVNLGTGANTLEYSYIHGRYNTCVLSSCGAVNDGGQADAAVISESGQDEIEYNTFTNGDAYYTGTSATSCGTNSPCQYTESSVHLVPGSAGGDEVQHNYIYDVRWQVHGQSGANPLLIHNNEMWLVLYDIGGAHENELYEFGGSQPIYEYNNIDHNNVSGSSNQDQMCDTVTTTQHYMFNNVEWTMGGGSPNWGIDSTTGCSGSLGGLYHFYNNTLLWYSNGTGQCINNGGSFGANLTVVLNNNQCFTSASPFWAANSGAIYENQAGSSVAANVTASNVVDTLATANSQGYVQGNLYAPTVGTNDSVVFASNSNSANLTSLCSGYLVPLCSDINGNPRPTSGGWQAGAYNFEGTIQNPIATVLCGSPLAACTSIAIGSQAIGTTSTSVPVTLENTGNGNLNFTSAVPSAQFGATNNCPATITPSSSCVINVTFSPTSTGSITGTLTITDNGSQGTVQTVSLSGTGTGTTNQPTLNQTAPPTVTHNSTTCVLSFTSALPASSSTFLHIMANNGTMGALTLSTLSDGVNSYTFSAANNGSFGPTEWLGYKLNITSPGQNITATFTGGTPTTCEMFGRNYSPPAGYTFTFDAFSSNGSGTGNVGTPALTPNYPLELFYGGVISSTSVTAINSPFTGTTSSIGDADAQDPTVTAALSLSANTNGGSFISKLMGAGLTTGSSVPSITSASVSSAVIGATGIVFTGTNLGSLSAANINGSGCALTVTENNSTTFTVTIPSCATTGGVTATNSGGTSNSFQFAITPQQTSLSLSTAVVGTSITSTGTGYGSNPSVMAGGVAATVTASTSTSVTFTLANTAVTGNVIITSGTQSSNSESITIPPTLSSVSPTSGYSPQVVTLGGFTFGSTCPTVTFYNSVSASPTVCTSTSVQTPVPAGAATGNITLTTASGSATIPFTVTNPPNTPIVSGISPSQSASNVLITFTGTNFGSSPGTITFGTTQATAGITWSNTQVQCLVPPLAPGTYNVYITNSSGNSNVTPFPVLSVSVSFSNVTLSNVTVQ